MKLVAELPRSTPEQQGVSSDSIALFVKSLDALPIDMHGLMIIRNGHVITEGWWTPYRPEYPHMLYSISKSFTAMAIGLAIEEGMLSLQDRLVSFFRDELDRDVKDNMSGITVEDLLKMTTGHVTDTARFNMRQKFLRDSAKVYVGDREDENWVKGFFDLPIERSPGSHFLYNSGASFMLSAIIHKLTGQALPDFLYPRLLEPIGIKKPQWDTDSIGRSAGGWGLRLTTEDIARFGLLLLQQGVWNGVRLVSESWVKAATTKQVDTPLQENLRDWSEGYGYQFWRCRHGAYRADGAFGQFCIVLPEQQTVISIQSCSNDLQAMLNVVWEQLLPAFQDSEMTANNPGEAMLHQRLSSLSVVKHDGLKSISHHSSGLYLMSANDEQVSQVKVSFGSGRSSLAWTDSEGEHLLHFGIGSWVMNGYGLSESAMARGDWINENVLELNVCRIYTPYRDQVLITFNDNHIQIQYWHHDFAPQHASFIGKRRE